MVNKSASVRSFYERNTKRFLSVGGGRSARVMHREVWGEDVSNRMDALHYPHRLVLDRLHRLEKHSVRVLDLGCGVGSSLFYLCRHFRGDIEAVGVSISATQVETAKLASRELGLRQLCHFVEADFQHLPELGSFDIVFGIESFVHAPDSGGLMAEISKVLNPTGSLLVIDDFLQEEAQNRHISRFVKGWRLGSLQTVPRWMDQAADVGLVGIENLDLTPLLNLGRPRDKLLKVMLAVPGVKRIRPEYLLALDGGDALQTCIKRGWIRYRLRQFPVLWFRR